MIINGNNKNNNSNSWNFDLSVTEKSLDPKKYL